MRRIAKYISLVALILWAGTWTVTRGQAPQPGSLDPSFGTAGMATTSSLTGGVGGTMYGSGMAVQRINGEDRVVAIGSGYRIARYLSTGSLDATFGTGGVVTRTFPKGGSPAHRVVVQPDNKLLVVGLVPTATKPVSLWTVAVTRYMPNGQYDTTFGPDHTGTVMLAPQGISPQLVLQSDGKIVVAGAFTASPSPDNLYVIRLETDGRFDLGFGPAGNGVSSFPGAGKPHSMALQRVPNSVGVLEERIVVSTAIPGPSGSRLWYASVMRLTSTGSLDQAFAESGVAEMAVPGANETQFFDIAVDASNRILAAGYLAFYSENAVATRMLMARYLGDGTLDPSFGNDGTLRQDWVDCRYFRDVAIQPNGSILASGPGNSGTGCTSGPNFVVWRFLEDGSPDPGFGSGGVVENHSANQVWGGMVLVRRPDGTAAFIVGGSAPVTISRKTTFVWALWRYFY